MSQTSCHEDLTDATSSMVATDLSSGSLSNSVDMDGHDAAVGASHLTNSVVNGNETVATDFKYVSIPDHHRHGTRTKFNTFDSDPDPAAHKLSDGPELVEKVTVLWNDIEGIMGRKQEDTRKVLEVYGIGEGEEDSETEEGQLWRMVQGDAPYTLNMV